MDLALYTVSGLSAIFGAGVWLAATKSRSVGHVLGGACYVGAAVAAIGAHSWWPLPLGFVFAFFVRKFFGDPWRASSVTSRSDEFQKISATLGNLAIRKLRPGDFERVETAENRLFTLIEADPELRSVYGAKGADVDYLRKVYKTLILSGAGQWAGSVWVPAASITTPYTLDYLLRSFSKRDLSRGLSSGWVDDDEIREAAYHVLKYFQSNEVLP